MRGGFWSLLAGLALGAVVAGGAMTWVATPPHAAPETTFEAQRGAMVRAVTARAQSTAPLTGIASIDRRVLDAMSRVPRHQFVPPTLSRFAYLQTPLPLGHGQNIASPYIVAMMTHLADVQPGTRVLETGTGAGYQAAVLAELGAEVVSIEVVGELANEARLTLAEVGHAQVETHIADGYYGWREGAPYDAILVKEAVDHVPDALLGQLSAGGRLVLPLGPLDGRQYLTVITKQTDGEMTRRRVLPVRFSPLQGGRRT
jgi:protein-L-isoaspartate(D-aspartate) O-methyltransferase